MSRPDDYYGLLGVARDAAEAEIKKAYRGLAMKYHPDRVASGEKPAAEEKFKEITEAYEVLRDPEKRAAYDRYGVAGVRGAGAAGGGVGFAPFHLSQGLHIFMRGFRGPGGFGALFRGGGRGPAGRPRGEGFEGAARA